MDLKLTYRLIVKIKYACNGFVYCWLPPPREIYLIWIVRKRNENNTLTVHNNVAVDVVTFVKRHNAFIFLPKQRFILPACLRL